jgi:hypothetical protein
VLGGREPGEKGGREPGEKGGRADVLGVAAGGCAVPVEVARRGVAPEARADCEGRRKAAGGLGCCGFGGAAGFAAAVAGFLAFSALADRAAFGGAAFSATDEAARGFAEAAALGGSVAAAAAGGVGVAAG